MKLLNRSLTAAVLILAVLAASASAKTVTIRVEGLSKTLVPATKVTIPDSGDIAGAESECDWNEQSGALEAGTQGNWDRKSFTQVIMGESYAGSSDTTWFSYSGGKYGNGICFTEIAEGEEVIITASKYDASYNPTELPLFLRDVPARVDKGKPFSVRVEKIVPEKHPDGYYLGGTGSMQPAEDVVVQIGGATAKTGADGRATITVGDSGQLAAQARTEANGGGRSEPVPVCVSCDPAQPVAGESTGTTAAPSCVTSGTDGFCGSIDRQPPQAVITGVREGQSFGAGAGPRELAGRIGVINAFAPRAALDALRPDPSGLLAVKLRLTRNDRGRCSTFSGSKERFVARRCGASNGWWFGIGDKADWSYLLPSRLPRGRYVLDVNAIDKAFNRDDRRRRGENRVVFRVR